jgi:molybdopterin-biosynthesis enzyme MoeA-like protein
MTPSPLPTHAPADPASGIGLVVVGDEILSGKRADKHLAKCIELLGARGMQLDWAEYVGDSPERITHTLRRAFTSEELVFCTGGIGATPDDHTRQCAARALAVPLQLHPEAEALIRQRMQDMAREQGLPYDSDQPEHQHRLNMGVFAQGARIIPNPYNKIPGFSLGHVHFVPGFPAMAWPMMAWVLDTLYPHLHHRAAWLEKSVIVFGAMEAMLTPLMQDIERKHPGVKVFSLPSVDHPAYGRHIELGVKGAPDLVVHAWPELLAGLHAFAFPLGPELVRP